MAGTYTALRVAGYSIHRSLSGMAGIGSANQIHSRKVSDNFYLCGDETSDVAEMGSLICPRVAVCAGHQALTALRLLANVED